MEMFVKVFSVIVVTFLMVSCQEGKDDEKAYEFGFTIDGQQHRHEKKDIRGIVQGEYGFVTADGIYHVTIYATDENGNFHILKMRNVRISAPLDGSPLPPGARIESYSGITVTNQVNEAQEVHSQSPIVTTIATTTPQTQGSRTPFPFTTQPTIKPACGGCGYVTTAKPIPGQPFPFQTAFKTSAPGASISSEIIGVGGGISEGSNFSGSRGSTPSIVRQGEEQNIRAGSNYPTQEAYDVTGKDQYISTPVGSVESSVTYGANVNGNLQNNGYPTQDTNAVNSTFGQEAITQGGQAQRVLGQIGGLSNEVTNTPQQSQVYIGQSGQVSNSFNQGGQSLNQNQQLDSSSAGAQGEVTTPGQQYGQNQGESQNQHSSQGASVFGGQNGEGQVNTERQINSQEKVNTQGHANTQEQAHNQGQKYIQGNQNNQQENTNEQNQSNQGGQGYPQQEQVNTSDGLQYSSQGGQSSLQGGGERSGEKCGKSNGNKNDDLSGVTVSTDAIHVPGYPDIPIKDKYPGMVDGLPNGVNEKDISDLLYKFNYTVGFHGQYETGYKSGAKVGGYFVNGRDGISRIVTYVADENGFRPKVRFANLGLDSPDTPREGTEKTFGLKSFEFVWYPIK